MKERVTPRERHTEQRKRRENRDSLSEKKNIYAERDGCNSSSHHSNNCGTILVFFSAKANERTMKKKKQNTD